MDAIAEGQDNKTCTRGQCRRQGSTALRIQSGSGLEIWAGKSTQTVVAPPAA